MLAPILLACSFALAPSPAGPVAAPPSAGAEAASELARLQKQFGELSGWLRSKGRLGPDERRELEGFRDAATRHAAANPDDATIVALLVQANIWLDDAEAAQAAFRRLAELRPGDGAVVASWSRWWLARGEPAMALAIIEQQGVDPSGSPRLALTRAEALLALERFDDALATLDLIPQDPPPAGQIATQVAQVRTVLTACVAAWPKEQELRAADAARGDLPQVEILTPRGRMVFELFEEQAPNTVANFIVLAEKGFYDGTRFHRVIPGFMAQGGDPNSRPGSSAPPGSGGPGYVISCETELPDARSHFTGSLAMAHRGKDTGGSQFYVTFAPPTHLNGRHTVFGRLTEGLPVLMQTTQNDEIVAVRVLRKRDHAYEPTTLPEPAPTPPRPPVDTGNLPRLQMPPRPQ